MFMKKPRHRVFDYSPRHYVPEQDVKERKKRKLGFSKQLKHKRKSRSVIIWIILGIVVYWVMMKLAGMK